MKQTAVVFFFISLILFCVSIWKIAYTEGRNAGRAEIPGEFSARVDSLCGDDSTAVTIKSIKIIYEKKGAIKQDISLTEAVTGAITGYYAVCGEGVPVDVALDALSVNLAAFLMYAADREAANARLGVCTGLVKSILDKVDGSTFGTGKANGREEQKENSINEKIKVMTKNELIRELAVSEKMTLSTATTAVDGIVRIIKEALLRGEGVNLRGFGTLSAVARGERKGVNPKTGEAVVIPAGRTVKFKPGKELKAQINGGEVTL